MPMCVCVCVCVCAKIKNVMKACLWAEADFVPREDGQGKRVPVGGLSKTFIDRAVSSAKLQ